MAGTGTAFAATGGDHLNKGDTMYANDNIHNPAGTRLPLQRAYIRYKPVRSTRRSVD